MEINLIKSMEAWQQKQMKKVILSFVFLITTALSFAQMGINTANPDASAALDVVSTTQGLLPPRMTKVQLDAIASPAEGLMVYCLDCTKKGLYVYNGVGFLGTSQDEMAENATCATATISKTNCTTTEVASGIGTNPEDGNPYEVVNIGDQCWMAENVVKTDGTSPGWENNLDKGWYGYYGGGASQGDKKGTLFQWSAAMNNSTTERTQGVCPTGWHVPSDCEFIYLEDELGMTTEQQETTGWRGTDQGTKLKPGGSSGFEAIGAGYREAAGSGSYSAGFYRTLWWTSTGGAVRSTSHEIGNGRTGIRRMIDHKNAYAWSVRCLKN